MIRDPRDIVVSQMFYVLKRKRHSHHQHFSSLNSDREKLMTAIKGEPSVNTTSIGERLEKYSGWLDSGAFVVRFEDLIGYRGGGSEDKQRMVLKSIFDCFEKSRSFYR